MLSFAVSFYLVNGMVSIVSAMQLHTPNTWNESAEQQKQFDTRFGGGMTTYGSITIKTGQKW